MCLNSHPQVVNHSTHLRHPVCCFVSFICADTGVYMTAYHVKMCTEGRCCTKNPELSHQMQVFAVYGMQHLMLIGLMLPWYAICTSSKPWQLLDTVAVLVSAAGIAIAAAADNSLHSFVSASKKERPPVLREGLWGFSRHPNHFGEQVWWWGVALFAVAVDEPWTLIGTAFNSLCMWKVCSIIHVQKCQPVCPS